MTGEIEEINSILSFQKRFSTLISALGPHVAAALTANATNAQSVVSHMVTQWPFSPLNGVGFPRVHLIYKAADYKEAGVCSLALVLCCASHWR